MERMEEYSSESDIKRAKTMLALCYDSITEIDDYTFIASVDGQYGIIDIDNEIKYNFQKKDIIKVGNLVFIKESGYCYNMMNIKNFGIMQEEYSEVSECGRAAIVRKYGISGIIGSKGNYIMPPIYDNIRLNKVRSNCIDVWVSYEGHQFITQVSLDGNSVSKLDEVETADPNVRVIATDYKKKAVYSIFSDKKYKLFYELFNKFNQVTNEKFEGIMYMKAYVPFGIVHTYKDNYAGLIRPNGQVIIPNTRYKSIESIGYNGIYLVAEHKDGKTQWGVYQEGRGLVVDTCFTYTTTKQGIPMTYLYRKINNVDDWWILGNNGNVYREAIKAFPLFKLDVAGVEAYRVDVYGHKYTINSKFEQISIANYDEAYWKRVN